jgi:hypothetical protein
LEYLPWRPSSLLPWTFRPFSDESLDFIHVLGFAGSLGNLAAAAISGHRPALHVGR